MAPNTCAALTAPHRLRVRAWLGVAGIGVSMVLAVATAQTADSSTASAPGDVVVRLVDRTTQRALVRTEVDVLSDNGIRCVRAPCPTNSKQWHGTTDDAGMLRVPAEVVQQSMVVRLSPEGDWIDLSGAALAGRDGKRQLALPRSHR